MLVPSLILVGSLALAGCITTDGSGKPIARETKAKPVPALDAAMAAATLDGSRVVASGKPGAVSFLYPGTGRLSIRDLNTNFIPFSIEPSAEPGAKTLIAIGSDGKVTGTTSASGSSVITELAAVDKSHVYVITYQAATAAPAER